MMDRSKTNYLLLVHKGTVFRINIPHKDAILSANDNTMEIRNRFDWQDNVTVGFTSNPDHVANLRVLDKCIDTIH
jgi:hypothetical protein